LNRREALKFFSFIGFGLMPGGSAYSLASCVGRPSVGEENEFRTIARLENIPVEMNIYSKQFLKENIIPRNEVFQQIERRMIQDGRLLACKSEAWGYKYQFGSFADYEDWNFAILNQDLLKFEFSKNYRLVSDGSRRKLIQDIFIGSKVSFSAEVI
jgi:hypothetical protein